MPADLTKLRNIGVIAHIDAGKTTVTERMLFVSSAKHRVGEVDKGTTTTDDDAEEAERGITIYSACVQFPWKDVRVNLIDTPGHVDFTAEVERSLRVLDGAVVVFSAREGVEAQSETVWRQANRYHVPRIALINKMDREGANWEEVLSEIESRLGAKPVAIQIPAGQGPPHVANPFRGIIDLIKQKLITFPGGKDSREVVESPIPDEFADDAALYRDQMLEQLYGYSDELMELALGGEEIPEALIRKVLRSATVHLQIQPVLCGSALHGMGVEPLLDAVAAYLPHPLEMPPVEGVDPTGKAVKGKSKRRAGSVSDRSSGGEESPEGGEPVKKLVRKPDIAEPFCGLVFKILPYKTGDLYWVRVYSGELKPNSRVLNPGKDLKENVAQIWRIHASKKDEQLDHAEAGDIVALLGLRDSVTGDTLCDTRTPILLESIEFPDTVISMAIEAENSEEKKKLAGVLEMLRKQDPTFRAIENEETGETLISGMGELHLEVIQHRLARDFGLKFRARQPRVSYRESVARKVEVTGECNRNTNGVQHTAAVRLRVEPFTPTGPLAHVAPPVVVSVDPAAATTGGLTSEFVNLVVEELESATEGGGTLGFPLLRLKVTVLGGEVHETDSTDIAFRTAASLAFDKGLREAGVVMLEPIMALQITTPDEHMGDLVGDLQQRRAMIERTEQRGGATVIHAQAPLANLFGYSSAMRSLSQGRAGCSMTPSDYAPAPDDVVQKFLGE
ncbi:elongation factor G [Botrimarina mediterranea]|uniref:Elongation factor G 2 n=1 Tax=Botrimarina mediterranea TaxID=2528022 RepID=A0A518KEM5_9BACT|nr:elongation factor G [Botrimarina mediterranea]QDV76246.1 Elongation factor G [Botrimarina mediterranea]QDV80844.1 Elongation factor G [Planctomycetes bacterium K2D]